MLVVVLVAVGVFGIGAARLKFATGQDSYLDRGTATAKANRAYQDTFGGESMFVLLTAKQGRTVTDLFTPANIAAMASVRDRLQPETNGGVVFSVLDPVTLLTWSNTLVTKGIATQVLSRAAARETEAAKASARKVDAQLTLARALGAGKQSIDNPAWVSFLLHDNAGFTLNGTTVVPPTSDKLVLRRSLQSFIPDERHALFVVVLKGNASLDDLAAGNRLVKDAFKDTTWENADAVITGTPTFLTEINDYLQKGMLTLGLFALAVMVFVLGLVFGVRWRFLPLVVVVVGVICGFGAFGFTGVKLSLVTISGLPILIGLGIDFAIQIHNRAQEEITTERGTDSPFAETLSRVGPPLAWATVVAAAAFLVMLISKVPMIRDFGMLLTIGIVALVVVGITVTVATLALREKRSASKAGRPHGRSERLVIWLGSLPAKAAIPLCVLAVVFPVAGLLLERNARIESDPINWANQGSTTIKNARLLERETGFATTLGVYVQTTGAPSNGIFTDQLGSFVNDLEPNVVRDEGRLVPAGTSLVSVLSYLMAVPGATPLAPTGLDLLQAYQAAPPDVQRLLVSTNGNAMQILFNVGPSSLVNRAGLVKRLDAAIADPPAGRAALPQGATATPSGLARVGVSLLHNLTAGRSALTYVTLLVVAAVLMLRFRNLGLAILTMIPVLFAVGAAAALVAALNITLSPITTVGAPLVVALCAEFSILITARYVEERRHGLEPRPAMDYAAAHTGRAFTASALATIGGFGVLVFSSLPLLRDFGSVVTLKIAVALLSALVVVPPIAVWADERGLLGRLDPSADRPEARKIGWAPLVVGLVLAVAGIALGLAESGKKEASAAAPRTISEAGVPATLPVTTVATTTTTVAPTTTTTVGGATPSPSTGTSAAPPAVTTLPPGPPEKPTTLVAGAIYDAFVAAGASPGVARCTADALVGKTAEDQLITAGIALRPPSAEAAQLVAQAADACGVTAEVQARVRTAAGG